MSNLIKKKVKDIYGDLWNEVAHKLGKQDFRIVGHLDGYITLFGEESAIQNFIDELDKRL
jgi:hypothetical protein